MNSVIIIGGGHNGLISAALLAQKGHKVTIFEAREACGGLGAPQEFHPGFFSSGVLHDTSLLDPRVVQALQLESHGLHWEGPTERVLLRAGKEPHALSKNEGLNGWFNALKPVVKSMYKDASPDLTTKIKPASLLRPSLAALKAGRSNLLEWTRLMPQCAEDTLEEWVPGPEDRALWVLPSLFGTYMAPLSPSSTVSLGLYWSQVGQQTVDGAAGITKALLRACEKAGVTLKTNAHVSGITVENNRATGVIVGQETHLADLLISTIGVAKTGLSLLPAATLPMSTERRLGQIRSRGNLAKVHFAIKGPCPWTENAANTAIQYQIGGDPMYLERAFDTAKAGHISEVPALDMRLTTLACPSNAPEGHHVLSVLVYAVPNSKASIWNEDTADTTLLGHVKKCIESVWPGFSNQCVSAQVLNPRTLEEEYGLPGGHLYHSEWALDQLWSFRPTGALARQRTLLDRLILAGSGTNGGGGLRGTAAYLAVKPYI